jgi:hypothetical protein
MGSGHACAVLLLASASTPEQSLSSTIGIATDLRRLYSGGISALRRDDPSRDRTIQAFRVRHPVHTLAMDLDTDRV